MNAKYNYIQKCSKSICPKQFHWNLIYVKLKARVNISRPFLQWQCISSYFKLTKKEDNSMIFFLVFFIAMIYQVYAPINEIVELGILEKKMTVK